MMGCMSKEKSATKLVEGWPGLFGCEAIRVNGCWLECSATGRGLKLYASPALAEKARRAAIERGTDRRLGAVA